MVLDWLRRQNYRQRDNDQTIDNLKKIFFMPIKKVFTFPTSLYSCPSEGNSIK